MPLWNTTQNRASGAVIKNMQHLHKVTSTFAQTLQECVLPLHAMTCLNYYFFKTFPVTKARQVCFPSDILKCHEHAQALASTTTAESPGWVEPGPALLKQCGIFLIQLTGTRCPGLANAGNAGYCLQQTIFCCSSMCCEGAW